MKIVVGLGNPGRKYAGTRHNVGVDVLAELAGRFSATTWSSNFEAQVAEVHIGNEKVLLLAPQTYMNLSGRSVRQAVTFFKVELEDLMVITDDLNLPTGQVRIRKSGSAGGQKGVQDTINQLGTNEFARLRIGIGRPEHPGATSTYVLQRFGKKERELIDEAVYHAASAVEKWVASGVDAAMNEFNRSIEADRDANDD